MARDPVDQLHDDHRNPKKVATEDEPVDLIEANDPDEGSDPDATSPVNRNRDPSAAGRRDSESMEAIDPGSAEDADDDVE